MFPLFIHAGDTGPLIGGSQSGPPDNPKFIASRRQRCCCAPGTGTSIPFSVSLATEQSIGLGPRCIPGCSRYTLPRYGSQRALAVTGTQKSFRLMQAVRLLLNFGRTATQIKKQGSGLGLDCTSLLLGCLAHPRWTQPPYGDPRPSLKSSTLVFFNSWIKHTVAASSAFPKTAPSGLSL